MKERLTGAIILVAVLVLLVPELLSGPEGYTMSAEGAGNGAPLRSYTIDLAGDAPPRATAPTSAATVVTEDPVAAAVPEPEGGEFDGATAEASGSASGGPSGGSALAEVRRGADADRAAGSGADRAAATPPDAGGSATKVDGSAAAGSPTPPSAADDQPRSAFGPNAVQRPKPAASEAATASKSAPAKPAASDVATASGSASAPAGRDAAAKPAAGDGAAASRNAPTPPARTASRAAEPSRESSSSRASGSQAPRPAASDAKPAKGWAVQLGVFASRENAERLAKQVKGKGYTVSVNETSGSGGKRMYRVRVGPAATQPAAAELGAKLRSDGHKDARVVSLP